MSGPGIREARAVEALMLEKFETEPFHNLRLLYGDDVGSTIPGGTCSDKTLSFLAEARGRGFDVALHSAYIDGVEKHRLARVHIEGRTLFADVGNGWPSLRLYPADREVAFRCFGLGFRTEVSTSRVAVFCERRGRESLQLEIDLRVRSEREIMNDVERRFRSGVEYPFGTSLRFSAVVSDRFLFLRGDRLEIHRDGGFEEIVAIEHEHIPSVVREHFGVNVDCILTRGDNPHGA
jgi:arylamine N-acetyltransferase